MSVTPCVSIATLQGCRRGAGDFMTLEWVRRSGLIRGGLFDKTTTLPFSVQAGLCDLRPRFLPKANLGRGYRAIARNGRVLLAAHETLADLIDRPVRIRFQVWHRVILIGDRPEPYGIVAWLQPTPPGAPGASFLTRLVP